MWTKTFGDFLSKKAGGLVSKKLAGAIGAEALVAGTDLVGWPLMVYLIAQAVVDACERIAAKSS
tara:strand:+ start:1386 stop:1577 length:192 start_codon:yes stop_codon:yes gene_type:complete